MIQSNNYEKWFGLLIIFLIITTQLQGENKPSKDIHLPIAKIEIYKDELEKKVPFSTDVVVNKIELEQIFYDLCKQYRFPVQTNNAMMKALKRQKALIVYPKKYEPLVEYKHLYLKTIQKAFRSHGFTIVKDGDDYCLVNINSTSMLNLPDYNEEAAPIDEIVTLSLKLNREEFRLIHPHIKLLLEFKELSKNNYFVRGFRSDIKLFIKKIKQS
jgi:hypothetical protein